jgi:hypothetical protein
VRHGGEEARLGAVGGLGLIARLSERLHLGVVQFPIPVGELLDPRLELVHAAKRNAPPVQHDGDDGESRGA